MTNDELKKWLELDLFHLLVTLGIHQRNHEKSRCYDELLGIDTQIGSMATAAVKSNLITDKSPWPRINPNTITLQTFRLGYIEEAMRAKAALEELGLWEYNHDE